MLLDQQIIAMLGDLEKPEQSLFLFKNQAICL